MVDSPVPHAERRYFPETGCTVEGAFLEFLQQYGIEFCGLPLTDSFLDAGTPTQYFQRLALEEPSPGQLRLKAIGAEVIHLRAQLRQEKPSPLPQPSGIVLGIPPFELINQVGSLPRHATLRYASRPLDYIRQLVIHHTGAPESVGAEQIAGYHVTSLGWPAIGYHFIIDQKGSVAQTNALATISHHARQYNGSGVGIALVGNFEHSAPPTEQIDGAAVLCAWLLRELSLPIESIKGHQELVGVTCPGDQWLEGARWKFALMDRVEQLLAGAPIPIHGTANGQAATTAALATIAEGATADVASDAAEPDEAGLVSAGPSSSGETVTSQQEAAEGSVAGDSQASGAADVSPVVPSPQAAAQNPPQHETAPEVANPATSTDNRPGEPPTPSGAHETSHGAESSEPSSGG
ncbi:MAG: N-acetylmuramoyl-L-alanine amidase [Anaerolineae bacterium]